MGDQDRMEAGASEQATIAAGPTEGPGEDPRALSPAVAAAQRARLMDRLGLGAEQPRFGRFSVVGRLGEGGMGVVLAAHDPDLGRNVALKLLAEHRVDAEARARLVREARSLAKLSHPHIVQVFEVGELDGGTEMAGMPYLAMELVEGTTLREWVRTPVRRPGDLDDDAPLAPPDRLAVLRMFLQIGEGLAAAHEAGVVHRDFKPENVLVGEDGRPRIADFGLAHGGNESVEAREAQDQTLDVGLTRTGALMGTPAYMSPEQWDGKPADARSDQFSFCVALFEALYGRPPFPATNVMALREQVLEAEPVDVPSAERVPGGLHDAILRGLAREPADRWPTLEPLLASIRETIGQVQPGLFRRSPIGIVRVLAPLILSVPVGWWILELAGVVEYSVRSWFWVSSVQLGVMGSAIGIARRFFLHAMVDRRVLVMPMVFLPLMLAHRIAGWFTESFELMFGYDFLALGAIGLAVTLLLERGMWPVVAMAVTLALAAFGWPEQSGHVWLAFSLAAPLTVGTSAALARRRRPRVLLRGGGSRSGRSSPTSAPTHEIESSGSGPKKD